MSNCEFELWPGPDEEPEPPGPPPYDEPPDEYEEDEPPHGDPMEDE